ncbi:MAG: CbtB-domain containing protein [Acidimicrobiales bacterium]|nr:CbtB-domain containing protein [Acidimicrobiales bacterium]
MAAITVAPHGATRPIPLGGFVLLVGAALLLWLVTFEAGPVSASIGQAGSFFHELFHDGRHVLGVPCH